MPTKKTSLTDQKDAPITGVTITAILRDGLEYPSAIYKGTAPPKGRMLRLTLDNGVTYAGKVHKVTDADGEVLVEFVDGLTPEI